MSEAPVDEEELRLKTAFRAFQRKAAAVLGTAGLGAAVFLYFVQRTLVAGPTVWGLRGMLGLYAFFALCFSYKKRWGLAAIMLAWMAFSSWYLARLALKGAPGL